MISLVLLCAALYFLYLIAYKNYDYWKMRNVIFEEPLPIVGNILDLLMLKDSIGNWLRNIYERHSGEKYVGIYLLTQPCLVIRDWDLTKAILGQDNEYFAQNILSPNPKIEPIVAKSLFALHGQEWKMLRNRLTSAFNTRRLETIFNEMVQVAAEYQKALTTKTFNGKETLTSYSVDTIGHAVFGLSNYSLHDPGDRLRAISRELFSEEATNALRGNMAFIKPSLLHFLGVGMFSEKAFEAMRQLVWESVAKRERGELIRDDYISLLMEIRDRGGWKLPDGTDYAMEGDNMVAQALMFMAAGFSTTASGLLHSMYHVAQDKRVQELLRKEILTAFPGDEPLDFETLKDLKYLNCVVIETLRMHPGFPFVDRVCTKNYKVPETELVIEKGTAVLCTMLGLHYDKKYWTVPEQFLPDRHLEIPINTKPFFPFGHGPKVCLGQKFAILEMKVLLCTMLRHNQISLLNDKPQILHPNPRRFQNFPIEQVNFVLEPLSTEDM